MPALAVVYVADGAGASASTRTRCWLAAAGPAAGSVDTQHMERRFQGGEKLHPMVTHSRLSLLVMGSITLQKLAETSCMTKCAVLKEHVYPNRNVYSQLNGVLDVRQKQQIICRVVSKHLQASRGWGCKKKKVGAYGTILHEWIHLQTQKSGIRKQFMDPKEHEKPEHSL